MRGGRINLLLVRGKGRRLLLLEGFRKEAATIRAKVRSRLLMRQDRRFVISAFSLGIWGRIAPRGKDPKVSGQCSPRHQWDRHGHSLFLHPLVRVKETSISPKVLHKHLPLHRQARGARLWVVVEDGAHKQGH